MSATLFVLGKGVLFSSGDILPGGQLYVYLAGTSTKIALYSTSALSPSFQLTNPVIADANGKLPAIWINPSVGDIKYVVAPAGDSDPPTSPLETVDNYPTTANFTAADIGATIYPATAAEVATGLSLSEQYEYGSVLRYGLVPNSTGARSANSSYLQALIHPQIVGPTGRVLFPNITGADTYYFDAEFIQVRDGCQIDLGGCTLDFAGSYSAANDSYGFFTFIRDVTIENGSINVNYDGTSGTNNGMIMRIGSRTGSPFGSYTSGIEDEDLTVRMGNCVLRNLRLTTNNNASTIGGVLLLGGLHNVTIEDVVFNGGGVVENAFYYEFGDYHYVGVVATYTTSHAVNLVFRNIVGLNLSTTGGGALIHIVGANSSLIDGVHCDTCYSAIAYRCGEALFYNVGPPYVIGGRTRWHTIRNVTAQNCASTAISLEGSGNAATGYLSGQGLTDPQQRDLQGFRVEGFSLDDSISITGPAIIEGGTIRPGGASGGIVVGEDVEFFTIRNVGIYDGANCGIRAETANSALVSSRNKRGEITGCVIGGNTGQGISLGLCDGVTIRGNQIGFSTAYNASNEATQTSGIIVASDGSGVICDGNYVKTAAGTAYVLAGSGDRGCSFTNTKGERTSSGSWQIDGMAVDTATNIADKTAAINTASKYTYKRIYDTSNARVMVAQGAADVSAWKVADASVTVTPA